MLQMMLDVMLEVKLKEIREAMLHRFHSFLNERAGRRCSAYPGPNPNHEAIMIKAIAMDTTRRAVLLNLGAVAAASTAAGAVVVPAITPAVTPDPIGDVIAATPLSLRERVDRAVREIKAAYEEAGYGLTRWGVYHPASPRESFMVMALPPALPPPQFDGPGVYETRYRGHSPIWWVERAPKQPGFYRCRRSWVAKYHGKRWQLVPEAELKFVKKLEA